MLSASFSVLVTDRFGNTTIVYGPVEALGGMLLPSDDALTSTVFEIVLPTLGVALIVAVYEITQVEDTATAMPEMLIATPEVLLV